MGDATVETNVTESVIPHFPDVCLSLTDREESVRLATELLGRLKPDNWAPSSGGDTADCEQKARLCQWIRKCSMAVFQLQYLPLSDTFFTEGITNVIFALWNRHQPENKVIVRIFGQQTEYVIDRETELKNWRLLVSYDCAAPLLCTFANGIICGYQPGVTLDTKTVRDPTIYPKLCATMAKMHAIGLNSNRRKKPILFEKLNSFIENLPTDFLPDTAKQARFVAGFPSKAEIVTESAALEKVVSAQNSPVVFCHNDLLLKNILYNQAAEEVNFIDYEYAGFNYQAYDIGGHFCEFVGVEEIDFSLYPEKDFQLKWLRQYLKCWNAVAYNSDSEPSDAAVDELYWSVNRFAGITHFFWSVWAIIQAKHSTIDFDFLQYGIDRMQQYRLFKQKFIEFE